MYRRLRVILAALLLTSFAVTLRAADWPQWRGPGRDGNWKETGVVERFNAERLKPVWTAEIGAGYSGPTVADERVFITDRLVEPKQVERVHCFDAKSGVKIWSHTYDCPYKISYQAGPRACVTIDDDSAFALGAMGHLHVYDAGTGAILWKKNLNEDYQIRMPIWGIAAAPLIYDDLVILHIGGSDGACVVALDKKSGDEKWRALRDRAQYSAPVVVQQAGVDVVVVWTGDSIAGLDPESGDVYWRVPMTPKNMPIGISTPVVHDGHLFVTSFYDGSMMLKLNQDRPRVEKLWHRVGPSEKKTDALQSIIATPIMRDGHIYGVDSYGELRCLKMASGNRVWEDQTATPRARWSNIHMVEGRDRTWMFNERGELIIGRLSPQGFEEIDRTKLIEPTTVQLRQRGGVCWAHPAFADGHIFVRNDEQLACFSLEAD